MKTTEELERIATTLRKDIVNMLATAGSGHSGGALGMADIFSALYFSVLNLRPTEPLWEGRDRFYLSNGHIVPVQYAAMAEAGFFPKSELLTLRKLGSRLQGHPERHTLPGIENTSGPLGDGSPQSVGAAYLAKQENKPWKTYCVLSDGELQAGITWEAALFASKNQLGNLTWIIDRNVIQIDGKTEDIMPLEPLHEKFQAFGFHVIEVNGHDIGEFVEACSVETDGDPKVIIAHTIPGKGVHYMEGDYRWHGSPPGAGPDDLVAKEHQLSEALEDLTRTV